jgi:pyruvate kinase
MGPAVSDYEKILELIDAGMNVARINFSHGTHEEHCKVIQNLKKAREVKKVPLAIMVDTKGPEIRLGDMKNAAVSVQAHQKILLIKKAVIGDDKQISLTPPEVLDDVETGMRLLFDDGYIIAKVIEVSSRGVLLEMENSGIIKSHKSVSIPNAQVNLPAMTEQDISDITFACKNDVDLIAASFIRSADHVFEIQKLLASQGKSDILVIAKIENSLGVQNFDPILQVADGIMVARGDLGVELPLEKVPGLQKMMIRKCLQVAKPVTTATQMLESMITNPRPTRAEVSDVANAIYDSSSSVMLSGETAVGSYPIETVKMMKSIIHEAEQDFSYKDFFGHQVALGFADVSTSVTGAAVQTAYSADAKAIFVFTNSGHTARLISRFRPQMPIFAMTPSEKAYHQMAFFWGVIPVKTEVTPNVPDAIKTLSDYAVTTQLLQCGDLVVITTGSPFWIKGTTNTIIVESVGDVVVRAQKGMGKQIHGKILILHTSQQYTIEDVQGKIVVLSRCDNTYLPFLNHAIGIVLQNHPEDKESEKEALKIAKTLDIPIVVRADGALSVLRDGQVVTLDPVKRVVYKGNTSP